MRKFEKHIFICTNDKPAPKKCCTSEHGNQLVNEFNTILNEKGLKGKVRAQKSGCLDACAFGPSIVVYPEGTYYGNVQVADVKEIIEKDIENNEIVERLAINFE